MTTDFCFRGHSTFSVSKKAAHREQANLDSKCRQYQTTTGNKRNINGVSITQHTQPVSGRGVLG